LNVERAAAAHRPAQFVVVRTIGVANRSGATESPEFQAQRSDASDVARP